MKSPGVVFQKEQGLPRNVKNNAGMSRNSAAAIAQTDNRLASKMGSNGYLDSM